MRLRKILKEIGAGFLVLAFSTTAAWADSFLVDVNDDAFKFEFKAAGSGAELGWNISVLAHDDVGEVYALGAQVAGQSLQKANIHGALGVRFYYVDLEADLDGSALGIGGALTVAVPEVEALSFQFEGYVAPSVLSFGDLERNVDISCRALYRVLTNGSVYLGYRKANVDFDVVGSGVVGSGDVDEGLHVGIRLDL